MACNVQQLIDEAACFACVEPIQRQLAIVSLLCQVSQSGGGGGGGNIYAGAGNPNGVQSATGVAIYFDTVSGVTYWKTTAGTSNNEWT